jgi:hypothetical protein
MLPKMSRSWVVAAACGCVIVWGCRGGSARPAPSARDTADPLVLSAPVDHLDALAREPMVVEHPGGALFVTGYGDSVPHLWRSSDRGGTWSPVNVGTEADGAAGNSDVDLDICHRTPPAFLPLEASA